MHQLPILPATEVDAAAEVLRSGGLLGFPTETVYGLAADAENAPAVERIFAVKGRPRNHPLIVHIADASAMSEWAIDIPVYAWELAANFWPGPLTLILHRSIRAQDFVTGGHSTVGLRVPANPIGLEILRRAGLAVAAPSANRFGAVSPTTASHVVAGLSDFLDPDRDAVIDGGAAVVGVESTIVDCTHSEPQILRPGAISAVDIAKVTGLNVRAADGAVAAPGTLAAHYAPRARVHLVAIEELPTLHQAGLIALSEIPTPTQMVRLAAPKDAFEYARDLYDAMHRADDLGLAEIYAVLPIGIGIELAIADRLKKAAVGSGGSA